MGTFGGHAIPGCLFFTYGFWQLIQIYMRYFKCRKENSKFVSSTWFLIKCCGRLENWPIEPIIKFVLISIGLFLEIYTGTRNGVFQIPGNEQHATMYFFFGITSLIEILVFFKANLPPMSNYASLLVSFCVEFILFHFHLHGRTSLDVLIHTLLLYVLAATIALVILEMTYQDSLLIALSGRFLFMLQGSWFLQIGSILYKPVTGPWDGESHRDMMTATSYFAWHVGANMIVVLAMGQVMSLCVNRSCRSPNDDSYYMKRLINKNSSGQMIVNMNDDSEEDDTEFQKPY